MEHTRRESNAKTVPLEPGVIPETVCLDDDLFLRPKPPEAPRISFDGLRLSSKEASRGTSRSFHFVSQESDLHALSRNLSVVTPLMTCVYNVHSAWSQGRRKETKAQVMAPVA